MKILFIGNSHTYYNELPRMVRDLFALVGPSRRAGYADRGRQGYPLPL